MSTDDRRSLRRRFRKFNLIADTYATWGDGLKFTEDCDGGIRNIERRRVYVHHGCKLRKKPAPQPKPSPNVP